MSISCGFDTDYEWYYVAPNDFSSLGTSKRQRCYSCRNLIDVGADCGVFAGWRFPHDEIESRIYGEESEIPIGNKYMCEECTGLFFSLNSLGFCIALEKGESMRDLAKLASGSNY